MNKVYKIIFYVIFIGLILLFFLKDVNFKNMFYKNIKTIENPNELLVLVNKNNKLDKNYVPNDLEEINVKYSNEGKFLRKDAKEAFETLSSDASKLGYKVIAVSAYRNYEYQDKLFNYYTEKYGIEYKTLLSEVNSAKDVKYRLLDNGISIQSMEDTCLFSNTFNKAEEKSIKEFLNARLPICDTYIEEKLCLMK